MQQSGMNWKYMMASSHAENVPTIISGVSTSVTEMKKNAEEESTLNSLKSFGDALLLWLGDRMHFKLAHVYWLGLYKPRRLVIRKLELFT